MKGEGKGNKTRVDVYGRGEEVHAGGGRGSR